MKYLQIAVTEPPATRNPMHSFLVEHDEVHRAELWNWHEVDATLDLVLFRVEGAMDPYTTALDDAPFVIHYETARIDETSFFVYVEHETRADDYAFREPFLDHRVLTLPPVVFDERGETQLEVVGRAADVQAVVDDFPSAFDVRVDRISDYERGVDAYASLLTDRQREALSAAVELGYYEVPRTASVEAVASELGCATSTASDHLRKAEARLAARAVRR